MKKKILTIFLALVMLFSFAACTKSGEEEKSDDSKQTTDTQVTTTQEKEDGTESEEEVPVIDVSIFAIPTGGTTPAEDSRVVEYFNEKFKFNLTLYGEQSDNATARLNTFLASNDMPDMFVVNNVEAVKQQGCVSFTMEELEAYFPNTLAEINKLSVDIGRDPEVTWNLFKVDGELNQIPTIWYGGKFPSPTIWRKDILDELGKEVPATVEEWEDVFSAYYEKYGTYCYTGCAKNLLWQTFSSITGSNGITFWEWQVVDDKIVPGWTQPEQREILETLARWYEVGYIDKEFVTKDNAAKKNDFVNGNTIVHDWVSSKDVLIDPPYEVGSTLEATVALVPEATFALGTIPSMGSTERSGWRVWDPFTGASVGFGKHLENDRDKLHRLMDFLDTLNSDVNVFLTAYLGWEGENWDWTDDGQALAREEYGDLAVRSEYGTGGQYWLNMCSNSYFNRDEITKSQALLSARDELNAEGGLMGPDKVKRVISASRVALITEDGTNLEQQYSGLFTARDAMFVEIITGAEPIEAFDEFVEMWNENGGAELEELMNELNLGFFK